MKSSEIWSKMMTMNIKSTAFVFIIISLLAPAVFALESGDPAPPFVNPDLSRKHVWSKNYLGKQWVIVDFFATDCEGCKKEIPILEELQNAYESKGLSVLVFATDAEGASIVGPYFQQNPTVLTILVDRYQVAVKKYQVEEIPTVYLINPEGTIVFKEVGFREDLFEVVSSLIDSES